MLGYSSHIRLFASHPDLVTRSRIGDDSWWNSTLAIDAPPAWLSSVTFPPILRIRNESEVHSVEARLKELMLASLAGDARSYGILLNDVARHLRHYFLRRLADAHKGDADDLVQETLMALHTRRATYESDRPFTAWLHAIARYKLIDHFRRNRIRATVPLDQVEDLFAADSTDTMADRMDVERLLQSAPEKTRDLIYRTRIEGQSIAEVAQSTGLSETSVKVSIHRGIKAIAAKLRGSAANDDK